MSSLFLRDYGVTCSQSVDAISIERLPDLLVMGRLGSLVVADRPACQPLVGSAPLVDERIRLRRGRSG